MFDYESFFGNDKKRVLFNSFENDLNPYERNFMDDYNNWEDSLEDIIKKKENEFNEIFKPVQNHEEDLNVNEIVPLKNDFKYNDSEMDKEFKNEMELDEDKNQLNGIDDEIPEIGLNDDIPREEIIFEITKVNRRKKGLPKYPRIDDCKIFWRAKVNKWYITTINNAISDSDLPKALKKIIHSPSYKKFTQVVTCQANFDDLQKSMSTILCIGKETNKNQRQNHDNIQSILTHYKANPSRSVEKIIMLFKMTYEEVIERFYESKEFIELKSDDGAMFYDEELQRQKGISILEEKGLIKLFKSYFTPDGEKVKMVGRKRRLL
jgi:hypothetical protein